jgi:Arm DNA-binding domain
MYLEISSSDGKYWRLKYRFVSEEKRLALVVYPDVPLAAAREKRDDARKKLAAGVDPGAAKNAGKRAARLQRPTPSRRSP